MAITAESTHIFRRIIEPDNGSLPHELALYFKALDFPSTDHARYEQLSARARDGLLTTAEGDELDGLLHVDSLLSILRLKAERSLRTEHPAP